MKFYVNPLFSITSYYSNSFVTFCYPLNEYEKFIEGSEVFDNELSIREYLFIDSFNPYGYVTGHKQMLIDKAMYLTSEVDYSNVYYKILRVKKIP